MKNNEKKLLKFIIIILDILVALFAIGYGITYALYINPNNPNPEIYYRLYHCSLMLMIFFGIILIIIICYGPKVNIFEKKENFKKYKIKLNYSKQNDKIFIVNLEKLGYEIGKFEGKKYKVTYGIKNAFLGKYIVGIIDTEDFNDEQYDEYKMNSYCELGHHLIDSNLVSDKDKIYLTIVLCVSKINKNARKLITDGTFTDYKFYKLPIVISLSSKNIFIPNIKKELVKDNIKL